jgi:hypothetical protein
MSSSASRRSGYHDPWRIVTVLRFAAMLGTTAVALTATAQEPKPGDVIGDASVSGVTVLDTDIDHGGSFRWDGYVAAAGIDWQVTQAFSVGAKVRYEYEHWRFSTPTAFGATAPWTNIHRPQLGLDIELFVASDLSVFLSPQLEWGYESGAGASDAKTYGGAFGVTKYFSPRFVLGIGAGVYRQINETQVFPAVIVNWQIDDRWLLRNSLPAGPAGGPGIELAYAINDQWELAAGGVYRQYRFRLSNDGPVPMGIADNQGLPLYARLTTRLGKTGRLDFVAGAIVGGRLEVADRNGNTIASSDYETAPLLGIRARVDF